MNAARMSAAGEGWTELLLNSIDSPRLHHHINDPSLYLVDMAMDFFYI